MNKQLTKREYKVLSDQGQVKKANSPLMKTEASMEISLSCHSPPHPRLLKPVLVKVWDRHILRDGGQSVQWYKNHGDQSDAASLEGNLAMSQHCLYLANLPLEVYPTSTCTKLFYTYKFVH